MRLVTENNLQANKFSPPSQGRRIVINSQFLVTIGFSGESMPAFSPRQVFVHNRHSFQDTDFPISILPLPYSVADLFSRIFFPGKFSP